jgi:hypothetical protein
MVVEGKREWLAKAACGPDGGYAGLDFDPPPGSRKEELARAVCMRACPVRSECLEDALATGDHNGIRGGATGPELRKLEKHRRGLRVVEAGE